MGYMSENAIEEMMNDFFIPIKPKIITQLQYLMSKSDSIIADFGKTIHKDVALSAEILKTVNTAYFGCEREICDIQYAVCYMGKDFVNALATSILFRRSYADLNCCLTLNRFWDDAKDIGFVMRSINKKIQAPISDGHLYTIGLFHDCGIPALSNTFNDYKETLIEANGQGCNSIELEQKKYNVNHAMVGYYTAKSWKIPEDICNIILHHHDVTFISGCKTTEEKFGFAILKLAENFVHRNKRYCESPDWKLVNDEVLQVLGIEVNEYTELEKYFSSLIL